MPNRCYLLLLPVFCLLISSCGGLKPGSSSGKSGKHFETFYSGNGNGTQYFVKAVEFETADKETMTVDFTFRDARFKKDSTTVNYTITSSVQLADEQYLSAVDENGKVLFETEKVFRLFQERTKDGFLSRYTSKAPNTKVGKAFSKGSFNFKTTVDGKPMEFQATKKTSGIIQDLDRSIFSLYRR